MTPDRLKNLMSILLIATGALHLVVSVLGAPEDMRAPLAVFGVLYAGLGVWVRSGGRAAVLSALAASALGLTLGGSSYLQNGGPATLVVMLLIDVIVIGAAIFWVIGAAKAK